MRLRILHRTTYSYEQAPLSSVQLLRLTPRMDAGQSVSSWTIQSAGGAFQWTDALGNVCHTLTIRDPLDSVKIVAGGEVETRDVKGVLPEDTGELPREIFLRQTPRTRPDEEMANFAEAFREGVSSDRLGALHEMMSVLANVVEYQEGATDVASTAAEAFAVRRGVCQDHSHLFIGIARQLGVPARYVSGYLYDRSREDVPAAGHAWAAAWIDHLGWVGFDVSNRICTSDSHVSTAVGLDYDGAAPIRGMRVGANEGETLNVVVKVTRVDPETPELQHAGKGSGNPVQ